MELTSDCFTTRADFGTYECAPVDPRIFDPDKAQDPILSSDLSEDLKEQFRTGKAYGKIRGMTVVHTQNKDVEDAKILMAIKLRMK